MSEGEVRRDWDRYDPERLAVYRIARKHTRAIRTLLEQADSRGFGDEVNQTRRSTASITSNIKEGYGDESPARKIQYYGYAKASVSETWGHVDNLVDFGCVPEAAIDEVRDLQNQLMALLVTMIRNLREEGEREGEFEGEGEDEDEGSPHRNKPCPFRTYHGTDTGEQRDGEPGHRPGRA